LKFFVFSEIRHHVEAPSVSAYGLKLTLRNLRALVACRTSRRRPATCCAHHPPVAIASSAEGSPVRT
jgi:hypothetical protein